MFRLLIIPDVMLKGLAQLVKRTIQAPSSAPTTTFTFQKSGVFIATTVPSVVLPCVSLSTATTFLVVMSYYSTAMSLYHISTFLSLCLWLPYAQITYSEQLILLKLVYPSAEILGLAHSLASSIWFRILCNDKFHGIEWDSLSKELVNTHHDWFNIDEIAKLSDLKPYSKDALSSAVKRNAPEVLHAFYQSLCATQSCGGAAQHASIAADIQKESECACCSHTCQ